MITANALIITSSGGSGGGGGGFANPMTTLGDMIYENAVPAPARLAGNTSTSKEFLSQTGTGSASAAPAWGTIAASDLTNGVTGSGAIVLASSPTLLGTPVVGLSSYTAGLSNSPAFTIAGSYESAATPTFAEDSWTIQNVLGSGVNGTSVLQFAHSGSTGTTQLQIPAGTSTVPALATGGAVSGISGTASSLFLVANSVLTATVQSGSFTFNTNEWTFSGSVGGMTRLIVSSTASLGGNVCLNNGGYNTLFGLPVQSSDVTTSMSTTQASGLGSVWFNTADDTVRYWDGHEICHIPGRCAKSLLTAQVAAITSTTIYSPPATVGAGFYRISYVATITTASDITSVLGGSNGFQVAYTNGNGDSVTKTTPTGPTSSANTTGTMVSGSVIVYAAASSAIKYTFGYTNSDTSTAMAYDLAISVEFLGV